MKPEEQQKRRLAWRYWLLEIDDAMDAHFGPWFALFVKEKEDEISDNET